MFYTAASQLVTLTSINTVTQTLICHLLKDVIGMVMVMVMVVLMDDDGDEEDDSFHKVRSNQNIRL